MKTLRFFAKRQYMILAFLMAILIICGQDKPVIIDYYGKGVNFLPEWVGVNEQAKLLLEFDKAYHSSNEVSLREAACLDVQYKLLASAWQPEDLFAGRINNSALSILPQPIVGFTYSLDETTLNNLLVDTRLTSENKVALKNLVPFWQKENTMTKLINEYPSDMAKALPTSDFQNVPGIAFPLYRISGTQMDYDKLVRLGIPGLRNEIEKHQSINKSASSQALYEAMNLALNTLVKTSLYYADMLERQKTEFSDKQQIKDLNRCITALKEITNHKPTNFYEALQLCFLYAQYSGSINYGRMDEYLGDLYVADLNKKILDKNEAVRMMASLFSTLESNHRIWDSRISIGGKGRRNESNANQLALTIMDAVNKHHSIVPQLTLRFYEGQDKILYKSALDLLSTGYTYPMLYNDDVNIPSAQSAFNIGNEEAVNYLPYGCGEYIIYHKSVGTPSGLINMLAALNVTLHNGKEPATNKNMGLALGKLEDFKTFGQLKTAYKKQIEYYVAQLAQQEALEYQVCAKNASLLYLSMLFDDCIENGKPLLNGGVRYKGGTLEAYGNTNTADALAAIKLLVYDQKKLTLKQLVNILDKNFVGYEKERNMMLNAPKYGNDNDYVDAIKVEIDKHICDFTQTQNKKTDLHSYLTVIINNNANTLMGLQTAASADGRQANTYMANGNAPTGGADKNGLTAMLNSIVKPSTFNHAGAVQNIKFSKELFVQNREKVETLLEGYWKKGGAQAMLTVIGRDDLKNAMIHPEKYANLIVRVGGFCARFVELPKSVQLEVLSRTIY